MRIGLLLFDDVDLLDVGGPYEVFLTASRLAERLGDVAPFEVVTIGSRPVTAYGGLGLIPQQTPEEANDLDVLVVPGAIAIDAVAERPEVTEVLEALSERAGIVASVCTGAFLLGDQGLLDGLRWTTHWEDVEYLGSRIESEGGLPWEDWVDSGRIVTAGGLSAGISMALHLVERLTGRELAVATARQLQYDWDPEAGIDDEVDEEAAEWTP